MMVLDWQKHRAKEGSFSTLIQLIQIKTSNNIFLGGSLGRLEEIHN